MANNYCYNVEQAVREAATICPAPCKLTFDLLTLKVVSESRVIIMPPPIGGGGILITNFFWFIFRCSSSPLDVMLTKHTAVRLTYSHEKLHFTVKR